MNEAVANPVRIWSVGRVLPRLMLFFFVLDLALRLVPLDPLTFRAWEAMLRRYPNAVGPFVPRKHYHRQDSYGGVASIGNLPELRHYHAVDFTTDGYGFHNPPAPREQPAGGIVVGDSFAVGSELAEDETISAQLSKRRGRYFYNAGAPQPLRLRSLDGVAQRLHLQNGIVVFELLEARLLQNPPAAKPDGARGSARDLLFRCLGPEWTDRLATPINELHASPLEALAAKIEKEIQNNRILPNSFAAFVMRAQLRNGEPIVFLPAEFKSPENPHQTAAAWAGYLSWYGSELRKNGLQLTVLLVPNRTTIYAPLLMEPRDASAARRSLSEVSQALQNLGVSTVSLEPRFSREAPKLLNQKNYLYLLDDIHWNGNGTAIAADELARILR